MADIDVVLNWDGTWIIEEDNIPSNIPDSAGIYMILRGKKTNTPGELIVTSKKIIYIGEADKVRTRIVGHEEWPCWESKRDSLILLKVAPYSLSTVKRKKAECCLIFHAKPDCNTECKNNYPHKDAIQVSNKGTKFPLKSTYICNP